LESVFIFFRIRCRIRRIRVDGSRIRNEKVADSKISIYSWTGPQFSNNQFIIALLRGTTSEFNIRIINSLFSAFLERLTHSIFQ